MVDYSGALCTSVNWSLREEEEGRALRANCNELPHKAEPLAECRSVVAWWFQVIEIQRFRYSFTIVFNQGNISPDPCQVGLLSGIKLCCLISCIFRQKHYLTNIPTEPVNCCLFVCFSCLTLSGYNELGNDGMFVC